MHTTQPLLHKANLFADTVYHCNVHGDYELAIQYADSVLYYLNEHHQRFTAQATSNARLTDSIPPAELRWFSEGFTTDYYTLLDVRNEAAVAFLALNDLYGYRYNNSAYTTLYRQISKDNTLDAFCQKTQRSANHKIVGIILLLVLIGIFLIGFYVYHLRHRLLYHYHLEQVLTINQLAFTAFSDQHNTHASDIVQAIYKEMNELFRIEVLGIAIHQPDGQRVHYAFSSNHASCKTLTELMDQCLQNEQVHWVDGITTKVLPLWIETGGTHHCIGSLAFQRTFANEHEDDRLLAELIANYVAIIVYNSMILIEQKQQDIEFTQDELHRIMHEENMLHVQNQVLDNCLSTIKHETLYYPTKIKQLIDKLKQRPSKEETHKHVETISELIAYYKAILTILSSCASRQLEQTTFRRSHLAVQDIEKHVQTYFQKKTKNLSCKITLHIQSEALHVLCDTTLCYYLLESLIDEAIYYLKDGTLTLNICKDHEFARFSFTDHRRPKTEEELNNLFYPSLSRINQTNTYQGTIYLLCKQIIREHDEYAGRRGCRINAQTSPDGEGFTIWFTLPCVKKNK